MNFSDFFKDRGMNTLAFSQRCDTFHTLWSKEWTFFPPFSAGFSSEWGSTAFLGSFIRYILYCSLYMYYMVHVWRCIDSREFYFFVCSFLVDETQEYGVFSVNGFLISDNNVMSEECFFCFLPGMET